MTIEMSLAPLTEDVSIDEPAPNPDVPYEIFAARLGYEEEGFVEETVWAIRMPRERFLRIVTETLVFYGHDAIAAEMLQVARSIPHFPMGTWIHPTRGCGCIVGEWLVAQPEIERYNLAQDEMEVGDRDIRNMLMKREHGRELWNFGSEIDSAMRDSIADQGVRIRSTHGWIKPGVYHDYDDIDGAFGVVVIGD